MITMHLKTQWSHFSEWTKDVFNYLSAPLSCCSMDQDVENNTKNQTNKTKGCSVAC